VRRSVPHRLHNHSEQVLRRVVEVLEGLAVGPGPGLAAEVGVHILDGRLQPVEAIVQ